MASETGLFAVGIEPALVQMAPVPRREAKMPAQNLSIPRAGTKLAMLVAMLRSPEGASIAEVAAATGWQAHTVRGAMSGVLKRGWVSRLPL